MLRRLIPAIALVLTAACSSHSTAPASSTSIAVRVLDDRGDPVYRTQVSVTFDGQEPVSALTRRDGTVRLEVRDAGEYLVRVIPRAGYDGLRAPITKRVVVAENMTSAVDFTIYRSGLGI